MAEHHKPQAANREQESLDALHARLDVLEKKIDKVNEDVRGVAAFFFLLAVMLAAKLTMSFALAGAMILTIVYVVGVDCRTIKRSKRKRSKSG